jgi:hypothetical protein
MSVKTQDLRPKIHEFLLYWGVPPPPPSWSAPHPFEISGSATDTSQTPSEYHIRECRHYTSKTPIHPSRKPTLVWAHSPPLPATGLSLDRVSFHPNFFSNWPRALVSYSYQYIMTVLELPVIAPFAQRVILRVRYSKSIWKMLQNKPRLHFGRFGDILG